MVQQMNKNGRKTRDNTESFREIWEKNFPTKDSNWFSPAWLPVPSNNYQVSQPLNSNIDKSKIQNEQGIKDYINLLFL